MYIFIINLILLRIKPYYNTSFKKKNVEFYEHKDEIISKGNKNQMNQIPIYN